MKRKAATIQDIARLIGVSTATVSRALSHPERVAEPTRGAILQAVRETGYQVNHAARMLRRQRSGAVLALVPNMANPFFSEILSGLGAVLSGAGHGLLICDTYADPDPAARLRDYLVSGTVDGAVIFDGAIPERLAPDTPRGALVIACEWSTAPLPAVRVDNVAAGRLAVAHLVAHGHRLIGHVTGPAGNVLTESRLAGALQALTDAGLALDPAHVFAGDFSIASGARAAEVWLALANRPTAVFCASDEMAFGFMGAVQRAGVAVPGQVSVVGFDDIEVAGHLNPALTTIRQPRRQIGEHAARLVLRGIEASRPGAAPRPVPDEVLPVELLERQSVAAPASRAQPAIRAL